MKRILILSIKVYRIYISPLKKPSCRFYPTCSEYSYQSIKKHGFFIGVYHAILRIVKCHPFNKGGYDPVK